jgi:hypothetical protein
MKQSLIFMLAILAITCQAVAQEKQDEHLLDGTSMDYYYQNGSAVHAELLDGQFKYLWTAGPVKGTEGSEKYRSRKIGDKMYMVNFMVETNSTFVTIVFNFNQNVFSTSALIAPGTDKELILFDGGIIEQLTLKIK